MSIIDIPEGFHDPDAWLAEQRAEDAVTGSTVLAEFECPAITVDANGAYLTTTGTVRNRSQRGA